MEKIFKNVHLFYQIFMPILTLALGFQCVLITLYNRKLKDELLSKWETLSLPKVLSTDLLKKGDRIIAFTARDTLGVDRKIGLKESSKKLLLLAFSTICPACQNNSENWKTLYEKIDLKNWDVLGLSLDDEESTKKYATEYGFEFPIISIKDRPEIMTQYKIERIPLTMVIDEKQRVTHVWLGNLISNKDEVNQALEIHSPQESELRSSKP